MCRQKAVFVAVAAAAVALGAVARWHAMRRGSNVPTAADDGLGTTPLGCQLRVAYAIATDPTLKPTAVALRHVNRALLRRCLSLRTPLGATVWDALRLGIARPDTHVGLLAADEHCYETFRELFDAVIFACHADTFSPYLDVQPASDFGESRLAELRPLGPEGAHILKTRVRFAANLKGRRMLPLMAKEDFLSVETDINKALRLLQVDDDLRGEYVQLSGLDEATRCKLDASDLLFEATDAEVDAVGGYTHALAGRGVYYNSAHTFAVWINRFDHLTVLSQQTGRSAADVRAVWERLVRALRLLNGADGCQLAVCKRLGCVTTSPGDLGTALRAWARVRVPRLARRKDLNKLLKELHLEERPAPRCTPAEKAREVDGVLEVATRRSLGVSEWRVALDLFDGLRRLVELERAEQRPLWLNMYS